MDYNPAYNISRQCIKTAKYITTTFAFNSTSYLFNGCGQSSKTISHEVVIHPLSTLSPLRSDSCQLSSGGAAAGCSEQSAAPTSSGWTPFFDGPSGLGMT